MKFFSKINELYQLWFKKDGYDIKVYPASTYTQTTDIYLPPPVGSGDTLVGAASTQTLTNKTIAGGSNTISGLTHGSQVDSPASGVHGVTGNVVGTTDSQALTNKTIVAASNTITTAASGNLTSVELNAALAELQGDINGRLPSGDLTTHMSDTTTHGTTGAVVGTTDTQTLTNKTFVDGSTYFTNTSDPTKFLALDVSLVTPGAVVTLTPPVITGISTLVGTSASQALTNKTLVAASNTVTTAASGNLTAVELNAALAELQGDIDGRATSGALTTHTGLTSGVHGATGSVVGTTDTQALTNKDIDGATASNASRITLPKAATATLAALTRKQGTLVYDTTLNKVKYDDGSNLNEVGSGSGGGGGGINYIENPDAEIDTTGWTTYDDGASATPDNGVDGSPGITWTRNTTTPLRDTGDFKFTRDTADRKGEGVAYDFTIDSADKSKALTISFDVDATDADYTASDLGVYVYDVTNSVLIYPSTVNIAKAKYTFQATFVATTSTSYRFIIHQQTVNATGTADVYFDNFQVGPQEFVQGAPISGWQDASAIFDYTQFGTTTLEKVYYRRVGDSMEVYGSFKAGTVGGSTASIDFASGYTIDSSKFPTTGAQQVGEMWRVQDAVGPSSFAITDSARLFYDGSTTNKLFLAYQAGSNAFSKAIGGFLTDSDTAAFRFTVPIAEWAGSTVSLANTRVEYVYNTGAVTAAGGSNTTAFGYGPAGAAIGSIDSTTAGNASLMRVRCLTPIQATDLLVVQVDTLNNGSWVNVGHSAGVCPFIKQGTSIYGVGLDPINSTDVDVYFGNQGRGVTNATYAGSGLAWSGISTGRWRVVKCSNPLSIGQAGPDSMIRVGPATGHGSTGNRARTYTSTPVVSVGTDITYTSSSTNGDSFTINRAGVYSITCWDAISANTDYFGISLNAAGTTDLSSLTATQLLAAATAGWVASRPSCCSVTVKLAAGDVIRVATGGGVTATSTYNSGCTITQVAKL